MPFAPNTILRDEMLEAIGFSSVEDLFSDIPKEVRAKTWRLPKSMSELEATAYLRSVLSKNKPTTRTPCFAGGSLKEHFVPSFVRRLIFRQEFYTSYTAYQAEVSQGSLQALFEYQSLVAECVGLDVVNSSMYDYSTALGEAGLMAYRQTERKKILVPRHLLPERRSTLENYTKGHKLEIVAYEFDPNTGQANVGDLASKLSPAVAGVLVESPNLFGVLEDVPNIVQHAHAAGALVIQGFDLSSLGVLAPPGELGADIAIADGTTLVFPPGLGGPQLGIFATREELARKMPGRLIGATHDAHGRRAFAMTLQTREQHIRREKATSNICTNEALLAIGLGAHLAALGPQGLKELTQLNLHQAAKLRKLIAQETPWKPRFTGPIYNEFTIAGPVDAEALYERVAPKGLTPGYPLGRALPDHKRELVVCTTEVHTDRDHAHLVDALKEATA